MTNVPKLRSFQYRLIHRVVITNLHLHKWRKRENASCTFCGEDIESYNHLFIMCKKVEPIWIDIEIFMNQFSKKDINFNKKNVMMNLLVDDPRNVKNAICLMLKQYIYRQRCWNKPLNIQEFTQLIWRTQTIERFIAVKNNNLKKHCKKWGEV